MRELAKTTLECLDSDSASKEEAAPVEEKQEEGKQEFELDIDPKEEFAVVFKISKDGDLTFGITWPQEDIQPSRVANIMAIALHNISAGNWKQLMVRGVQTYGIDVNQPQIAQAILEQWGSVLTTERGGALCVDPTNVFKGQNNEVS